MILQGQSFQSFRTSVKGLIHIEGIACSVFILSLLTYFRKLLLFFGENGLTTETGELCYFAFVLVVGAVQQ